MRNRFLILAFALMLWSSPCQADIQGKEILLFQEIPRVFSASRHVLTVLESPATATIITRQDIVHSGYNCVGALLRYVAGVNFFQTSDACYNIGMRGVNGLQANNVLILVDGRPIYSPVRNTNQCALIPEVPDDIEKIEVVRGPGSVLYGSNAFSGVINIITRSPEAIHGVELTGSGGTFSDYLYSLTSGERFGKWSVKLVSAWTQRNSTQEHDEQVRGIWKMSGEVNYEGRPGNNYNLSFGFSKGKLLVASATVLNPFDQDGFDGFLRSRFNWDDLKLDIWWRHFDTTGDDVFEASNLKWRFDHIDLLLEDSFKFGPHTLIGGIEGRFASFGATTYDHWHNQFIGSLFAENRWRFSSRIDIFTGLRVDYHTEAQEALSPRLSVVYSLGENQSLRFSASRAFNYPSYLQNYALLVTDHFVHLGNEDLDPEKLTSFELAYQLFNPSGISMSSSVFYNYYSDIIDMKRRNGDDDYYLTYENLYDIYQYGVELGFQYRYMRNLLLRANYSYVWKQKKHGITFGPVPANQINGEIRYDFDRGFWVDFRLHWQDRSDYSTGVVTSLSNVSSTVGFSGQSPLLPMQSASEWQKLEGFTIADLSAGFISPDKRWNFAAAVHNLFHSTHREFPGGWNSDTTFTIRLSVYF